MPQGVKAYSTLNRCLLAIAATLLVASITVGQYEVWKLYHSSNLNLLAEATQDFFDGITHWRAFQNRLLGPATVEAIDWFSCSANLSCGYIEALKTYHLLAFTLVNCTYLFLIYYLSSRIPVSFIFLVATVGFQLLVFNEWYYPWDPLEFCMFGLLLIDIKKRKSLKFFYFLFFLWIFIKETAVFVPIWLLASRIRFNTKPKILLRDNLSLFCHAGLLFACALIITELLRHGLFVKSPFPETGTDDAHKLIGNVFSLPKNLSLIKQQLFEIHNLRLPSDLNVTLYSLTIAVGLIALAAQHRAAGLLRDDMARGAFVCSVVYFCLIWLSGIVTEARIYLPFWPMALALWYAIDGSKKNNKTSLS